MVGLIVVSHSYGLAKEIIKFCQEMQQEQFPIINAGGLDEETFGSNPLKIQEAIETIYQQDLDVVIFCDIGSSILNAQMAIDLLDEKIDRKRIVIADAPIVEGALIAATMNYGDSFQIIKDELIKLKEFKKV